MSDREFDLLDELYFIQSFEDLKKSLHWNEADLARLLQNLHAKGWVKCYGGPVHEVVRDPADLSKDYAKYHYLASKAGLLAHQNGEE